MHQAMERQDLIAWIDQYLLDELQGEELSRFRQRLETDAGFRQEVERQRALFRQARQVGRQALRRQLQQMHQRLQVPWPVADTDADSLPARPQPPLQLRPKRSTRVSRYTLAASIALLLVAGFCWYLLYWQAPSPDTALHRRPAQPISPERVRIRLEGSDAPAGFGFGDAGGKDAAMYVLIYPAGQQTRAYRFDDTLRLYGAFVPSRLALRLDPNTGAYTLREDSLLYPLQRYRPRQALLPVR